MLFLPALLFFVLSTGTSALAAGSKKPDRFLTVPTFGLDDDMDYDRAQGYWRPEKEGKGGPLVAYIGNGNPLTFYPNDHGDITPDVEWAETRSFVRILTAEDHINHMNEIYPHMRNGKFLEIPEVYKRDRLEIQLLLLKNSKRPKSAHVVILGQRLSNESVTLDVGYNDMEPSRGHGYWRPRIVGNVQLPVMAYIGAEVNAKMTFSYEKLEYRTAVSRRQHVFVRVLTEAEYQKVFGQKYDRSAGPFPTIPDAAHKGDRVTLYIQSNRQKVSMKLIVKSAAKPGRRK